MAGLFSTFNIGSLGITAQQAALDVTSHNIANANTDGYTRQRVDMESLSDNNVGVNKPAGMGVNVEDIIRIKDEFLDYQVRNQTSAQGTSSSIDKYLGELQNIMNEPSDTAISSMISTFFTQWQNLSKDPQSSSARTLVVQQTKTLTDQLNSTYKKLQDLKDNCHSELDNEVVTINSTLDSIDELNQQTIKTKGAGIEPNDLMDKRDAKLNSLSSFFRVNVDDKTYDGITVTAADESQLDNTSLVSNVDPEKGMRFSYVSDIQPVKDSAGNLVTVGGNQVYQVTYYKNGDMTNDKNKVQVNVDMTTSQYTDLDQSRILWADKDGNAIGLSVDENGKNVSTKTSTSKPPVAYLDYGSAKLFKTTDGSLKGTMSVQADVDKYIDDLNKLAKAIAFSVNAVESNTTSVSGGDAPVFFVNSDTANYDSTTGKLTASYGDTDESAITAGNITINKYILNDPMQIETRKDTSSNSASGTTDGSRALAIAQLQNVNLNIVDMDSTTKRSDFFSTLKQGWGADSNGVNTLQNASGGTTTNAYYTDVINKLAVQVNQADTSLKNQKSQLQSLIQQRDSVSAVSLDEEMTNLMKYNHAYQANAKVITTVSQLLDTVIGLIR